MLAGVLAMLGIAVPFDGTAWNRPQAGLPPNMLHRTFHSASMDVEVGYTVLTPADYDRDGGRRYPVIYFLHGRGGDENAEVAQVRSYLAARPAPPALVVFPNGGRNSKYLDAAPGAPMRGVVMAETMILRELIPHVDAAYRTDARREARAIQGFSMGGLGALRLAFRHPHVFGSVYAIAPALDDAPETIGLDEPDFVRNMLNGDAQAWAADTPAAHLARNADLIRGNKLAIDLEVGAEDELRRDVEGLATTLTEFRIPHRLRIVPGRGHSYALGDNFGRALQAAGGGDEWDTNKAR